MIPIINIINIVEYYFQIYCIVFQILLLFNSNRYSLFMEYNILNNNICQCLNSLFINVINMYHIVTLCNDIHLNIFNSSSVLWINNIYKYNIDHSYHVHCAIIILFTNIRLINCIVQFIIYKNIPLNNIVYKYYICNLY